MHEERGTCFHSMADPMGIPQIPSVSGGTLTQICSIGTCNGKVETVQGEKNILSHSSPKQSRAVLGQRGQLLIPQLMPWGDPEFPHLGEGDLPNIASFLSAK